MKTCKRCGEAKPLPAFSSRGNGRPQSYCKPCSVAAARNYAATPGGYKCCTEEIQAFVMAAAVHQLITTYARGWHDKA